MLLDRFGSLLPLGRRAIPLNRNPQPNAPLPAKAAVPRENLCAERLHGRGGPNRGSDVRLAICRRIVERHNGEITVRSKPGEGATFIVMLPVRHSEGEPRERERPVG
ncbi:MAG: hypothetical protein LLF99_09935 [Desulfobacteraceae bacterium]|nr:hypothetical protein [Desulfobacteraceae bacterium]